MSERRHIHEVGAKDAKDVCQWVDWCARKVVHEVELSNRAGTEQMGVCRLHLAPSQLYGYKLVTDDDLDG